MSAPALLAASRIAPLTRDLPFLLALVAMPAASWYLATCAIFYSGDFVWPADRAAWSDLFSHIAPPTLAGLAAYAGWIAFQAALMHWAPGRLVEGQPLPGGGRLTYRLNGLFALVFTVSVAILAVAAGVVRGSFLYDHFVDFITAANLVAVAICVVVHRLALRQASPSERRKGALEAFFTGATLNPRLGSFDFKFFFESRPGMILWVLIDLSCAAAQYERHDAVTASMILLCCFQILNVVDYFLFERSILSTWDLRHESFGFMLCWGTMLWVPLVYTLPALYMADNPVHLPAPAIAALAALNMAGYFIFRQSNLQKDRFRRGTAARIWGAPVRFIQTARGERLLTSGWWGLARHCNYLGDLMMGAAWCLLCGFSHPIPYFYIAYLTILLVTREQRDRRHCAQKYGADWDAYARVVRWRIFPGVY